MLLSSVRRLPVGFGCHSGYVTEIMLLARVPVLDTFVRSDDGRGIRRMGLWPGQLPRYILPPPRRTLLSGNGLRT